MASIRITDGAAPGAAITKAIVNFAANVGLAPLGPSSPFRCRGEGFSGDLHAPAHHGVEF